MMRNLMLALTGGLFVATVSLGSGCGSKPSCKLLYKRYKKCSKMPLTESAFLDICDKKKDKPRIKAEIACSKHSDCDKFKSCLKDAKKKARAERKAERQKNRAERMKKRWAKAMEKANKGDYSDAISFCSIWAKDLEGDLKKQCAGMAGKATDGLMKEITAKRDKGQVGYKEIKCWDLKRFAKKAGQAKLKAAETLCEEVKIARKFKALKEAVAKQLKKDRPYLPYNCGDERIQKMQKLSSDYAKKTAKASIELCYKKLAKVILEKKVPKMRICFSTTKKLLAAIKKYNIKDPKMDELVAKASAKCEKK